MTYEEHLDEVTTLITELFDARDKAAIDMVMRAQADDFFSGHDDDPSICTQQRAEQDARLVYKKYRGAIASLSRSRRLAQRSASGE